MGETRETRRRDSAATRAALLDAAGQLFAERGFDRTTVRDIATLAGVNQALLFRYFGSKEALFATVLARLGRDRLAVAGPDDLFARMLRSMLAGDRSKVQDDAIRILLRSSATDASADEIRREIGEQYVRALSGATDAPDGELRAQLVMAWVIGIDLLRATGSGPLAAAGAEEIVGHVLRGARELLERVQDVSPE